MVSAQLIGTVLQKAVQVATHSWEYGVVFDALLEWNDPKLSIWNDPFPAGGTLPKLDVSSVGALKYIEPFINTTGKTLVNGDGAYFDNPPRTNRGASNIIFMLGDVGILYRFLY